MKVTIFENDVPRLVDLDEALYIVGNNPEHKENLSIDWRGEYSKKSEDGLIRLSGLVCFRFGHDTFISYDVKELFGETPGSWFIIGSNTEGAGGCYIISYCSSLTTENHHDLTECLSHKNFGYLWDKPIDVPPKDSSFVEVNPNPIDALTEIEKKTYPSVLPPLSVVLSDFNRTVSFIHDPQLAPYFQELNDFWVKWAEQEPLTGTRRKMTNLLVKITFGSEIDESVLTGPLTSISNFYFYQLRQPFSKTELDAVKYLKDLLLSGCYLRESNPAYQLPLYDYGGDSDNEVLQKVEKRWKSEMPPKDKAIVEIVYDKAIVLFKLGVTSYRALSCLLDNYLGLLGEHFITRIVNSVYYTYDPSKYGSERDKL